MVSPARARTEELERASFSAWATLSAETKGREHEVEPDPLRTAFAVDVDAIIACTAFERLKDKSHTLLAPRGEGYRARLDHALAGARLARRLSRALRLNEDLTEAIALGRDLGATAFASAGDEALSLFTEEAFHHSHQSVRVVEQIERLNLTWEVRDGIGTHSMDAPSPSTREAEAVRLADRIVHLTQTTDDALTTGVVLADDLPVPITSAWGITPTRWVEALLDDAVAASTEVPEVRLSSTAWARLDLLEEFVEASVLNRHGALAERARGAHCLSSLVVFYLDNPRRLPVAFRDGGDPLEVRVIDFVSSVSDSQALKLFTNLFLPRRSPNRL